MTKEVKAIDLKVGDKIETRQSYSKHNHKTDLWWIESIKPALAPQWLFIKFENFNEEIAFSADYIFDLVKDD